MEESIKPELYDDRNSIVSKYLVPDFPETAKKYHSKTSLLWKLETKSQLCVVTLSPKCYIILNEFGQMKCASKGVQQNEYNSNLFKMEPFLESLFNQHLGQRYTSIITGIRNKKPFLKTYRQSRKALTILCPKNCYCEETGICYIVREILFNPALLTKYYPYYQNCYINKEDMITQFLKLIIKSEKVELASGYPTRLSITQSRDKLIMETPQPNQIDPYVDQTWEYEDLFVENIDFSDSDNDY